MLVQLNSGKWTKMTKTKLGFDKNLVFLPVEHFEISNLRKHIFYLNNTETVTAQFA